MACTQDVAASFLMLLSAALFVTQPSQQFPLLQYDSNQYASESLVVDGITATKSDLSTKPEELHQDIEESAFSTYHFTRSFDD